MVAVVLTAETVGQIYVACVHQDGEPTHEMVVATSIRSSETFNRTRLAQYREHIVQLLAQLPAEFRTPEGEVASKACYDQFGVQWTRVPSQVDWLFALGVAIEAAAILGPVSHWPLNHTDPRARVTIGTNAAG